MIKHVMHAESGVKRTKAHLVLGVDQTDSVFIDGYQQDLREVRLRGLLH